MKIILRIIVDSSRRNTETPYIDEDILHRIVVREGIKAYHSKSVDEENKEGYFLAYKSLCRKVADALLEVQPDLKYPKSFASMLIETANNNIYFAQHLPRLTDVKYEEGDGLSERVVELLEYLVFKSEKTEKRTLSHNSIPNGQKVH